MKVFPAIDLRGGRCVRLRQGRAADETVYAPDPVAAARAWQDAGAEALHVVDLDGAFEGRPVHADVFRALGATLSIPFEAGGGLRTDEAVRAVLDAGAARAVVGSRAASDPDWAAALARSFGAERIAVGIDARDGLVQVAGWTQTTALRAADLARDLAARGVRAFVFTDTATDGMLQGPNLAALAEVADAVAGAGARVVASGGFSKPADLAALAALGRANVEGAIVGKALWEDPSLLPAMLAAARAPAEPGEGPAR